MRKKKAVSNPNDFQRVIRGWSTISIAFLLLFFIGHILNPEGLPNFKEFIAMLFFPVGVVIGLVLTWRNELIGALVTTVCVTLFYFALYCLGGRFVGGPFPLLLAAPGILILAKKLYHTIQD